MKNTGLDYGISIIKSYIKTLPALPGVYRMLDQRGKVLYVGKAKRLKNRVVSYTQGEQLTIRLKRMVSETHAMEFVVTNNEVEALLLEANLIKKLRPQYNIRLMDDKSYSYLHLSDHEFPRLYKYRGHKKEPGSFYGPFISASAVIQSLISLYKVFLVRSCKDTYFNTRQRPCLQYHIKRCSAPCVGYISGEDYNSSVERLKKFLKGKNQEVQNELADQMYSASEGQNFEKAASFRDQLRALKHLQDQQNVFISRFVETDIFAIVRQGDILCIQAFFFRHGRNYGSHSFFPDHTDEMNELETLKLFLSVFYSDKVPAHEIITNLEIKDELLKKALSQHKGQVIDFNTPKRGQRAQVLSDTVRNAKQSLERHILQKISDVKHLESLKDILAIEEPIHRIEVYDNSHIQGKYAIGALIVAGPSGFDKKSYRKFTIKTAGDDKQITPGDDYGMMREVLIRRFKGSLTQNLEANPLPSLLIIDGGVGQLSTVQDVIDQMGIAIPLLAISKGPNRNAGDETFHMTGRPAFKLEDNKSTLHYLQRLRDEAHRFAITYHRDKRAKSLTYSQLDEIPGIGATRKKLLLKYFGSAKSVKEANLQELQQIEGINKNLAQTIYYYFHSS